MAHWICLAPLLPMIRVRGFVSLTGAIHGEVCHSGRSGLDVEKGDVVGRCEATLGFTRAELVERLFRQQDKEGKQSRWASLDSSN